MLLGQRAATGLYGTGFIVAHGLELPHRAHALEVAHVRTFCKVHAVHIGVDGFQGEWAREWACCRQDLLGRWRRADQPRLGGLRQAHELRALLYPLQPLRETQLAECAKAFVAHKVSAAIAQRGGGYGADSIHGV